MSCLSQVNFLGAFGYVHVGAAFDWFILWCAAAHKWHRFLLRPISINNHYCIAGIRSYINKSIGHMRYNIYIYIYTSKSLASRSAEVSSYTTCIAIGPPKQVLPIVAAAKSHSFATLFSEFAVILRHPFSVLTTTSQFFSVHLSSSQFLQLFAIRTNLYHPSPSQLNSFHLFSALLNSSQRLSLLPTSPSLFSTCRTCLNSSHLLPPPQLFPPLLTSAQLVTPLSPPPPPQPQPHPQPQPQPHQQHQQQPFPSASPSLAGARLSGVSL